MQITTYFALFFRPDTDMGKIYPNKHIYTNKDRAYVERCRLRRMDGDQLEVREVQA